jgi:hypothetical protein
VKVLAGMTGVDKRWKVDGRRILWWFWLELTEHGILWSSWLVQPGNPHSTANHLPPAPAQTPQATRLWGSWLKLTEGGWL